VVASLRAVGHEVYDFRNPEEGDHGFHWSEIDPHGQGWDKYIYRASLDHPIAKSGFDKDLAAMRWADVFVGVQPFGSSASIEMGWAAGQGKKTVLLLENGEPELMVKVFDHICCNLGEVVRVVEQISTDCGEPPCTERLPKRSRKMPGHHGLELERCRLTNGDQ